MTKIKNRFSIGEMSKLHHATIKTLRYYDEIGLLRPIQIDESNGYRYYSTEQFEQLNTINYLKDLGFSLKEIKIHLEHRNIDDFLGLSRKQKELTENKIRQLQQLNSRFQSRIEDINQARRIRELGVVIIKDMKERKIVRLMETISSEPELEISLRRLENMSNMHSSVFIGGVGLTIDIHQIQNEKFDEYNSIFILVEKDDIQNEFVTTLPQGKYACMYYSKLEIIRLKHENWN